MQREGFPAGVAAKLQWYVYRLIDPRNGETFSVGKGVGDRVFAHASGRLPESDDALDAKLQRIMEIRAAGMDVAHVIHRHGIEDESVAFEIEAVVIDAYPGLANRLGGYGSGDYGCRHVEEIIREYEAETFTAAEPLILISIARSFEDESRSIYDAARAAWVINPARAAEHRLVLAHRHGIVLGAFRPVGPWLSATKAEFPWLAEDIPGRWGFVGEEADHETTRLYVGKRVPDRYRPRGAANPIRFIAPDF